VRTRRRTRHEAAAPLSRYLPAHDGEHWFVRCDAGHRHYGEHGAAGLLLAHTDALGTTRVLLHHRGQGTHHAGTWGWPGGAVKGGETAEAGARREAFEETGYLGFPAASASYRLDHGGWAYTTFLVRVPRLFEADSTWEGETAWLTFAEAIALPLVPGAKAALVNLFEEIR